MVDRDLFLFAFWVALMSGSMFGGVLMLWLYGRQRDIVALMFGISSLWLAGAFGISATIRAIAPCFECQVLLVWWQRSCFAVTVIFLLAGVDALVRSHNGNVPRIRKLIRPWEATD